MPSKPATKLYTVYYTDGTYLSYDLTKKDYDMITDGLQCGDRAVITTVGILGLADIRSVIVQRKTADVPQHEGANPNLPQEALDWMKAGKLGEQLLLETDDELDGELDYEGGMIS